MMFSQMSSKLILVIMLLTLIVYFQAFYHSEIDSIDFILVSLVHISLGIHIICIVIVFIRDIITKIRKRKSKKVNPTHITTDITNTQEKIQTTLSEKAIQKNDIENNSNHKDFSISNDLVLVQSNKIAEKGPYYS